MQVFKMTNERDWENTNGRMEHAVEDGSGRAFEREKARIDLPMEMCIRENGNGGNIMDLMNAYGQMGVSIKENGIWGRHLDMELNIERMDPYNMMESGTMIGQ